MAETESSGKPPTKPPGPDVEIPPRDVETCPHCKKAFHSKAGRTAKQVHISQCQGSKEGPLFEDNPKERQRKAPEVTRPPKKTLYQCSECGAQFYEGTKNCPGCGEVIEWE